MNQTIRNARQLVAGIDRHLCKSGEAENPRRGGRNVDDATAHEGTAIVDGHDDGLSIVLIGDLHLGTERQCAMGSSKSLRIQFLSACGLASTLRGVDRSNTTAICGGCILDGRTLIG